MGSSVSLFLGHLGPNTPRNGEWMSVAVKGKGRTKIRQEQASFTEVHWESTSSVLNGWDGPQKATCSMVQVPQFSLYLFFSWAFVMHCRRSKCLTSQSNTFLIFQIVFDQWPKDCSSYLHVWTMN